MLQGAVATLWLVVVGIERQLPVGVLPVSSVPAPQVGPAGRFSVRDHRRARCQGLPYCGGEVWGAIQVRFLCCQRQREWQCLFCGVPCGVVCSLTDRCYCCWHCSALLCSTLLCCNMCSMSPQHIQYPSIHLLAALYCISLHCISFHFISLQISICCRVG